MGDTIKALKALYVALGGSADDVAGVVYIPDMLNAIATVAAALVQDVNGIEGLPAVTGSNNGQILKVAEGEWTVAAEKTELPAVTATDNGSVLKVVDGEWAVGSDLTE